MQILHFLPVYVPAWQFGGPILSVSRLCEGLVSQGAQVRVITTNAGLPEFPDDQRCRERGVLLDPDVQTRLRQAPGPAGHRPAGPVVPSDRVAAHLVEPEY